MAQTRLEDFDKEQLIEEVLTLRRKLTKKGLDLLKARAKVSNYREKIQKMKAILLYQRSRIVQLYKGEEGMDSGSIDHLGSPHEQ